MTTVVLTSRPDYIEVSYQLPALKLSPDGQGARSHQPVELSGVAGYGERDSYGLPVIRQFVAVPECDRVELEVEVYDVGTVPSIDIVPRAPVPGQHMSRGRTSTAGDWARVVDIQHARGQALARVEIYPVNYNPKKRAISYPREIRLRLKPVNARGVIAVNTGPFQSALSAVVPNLAGGVTGAGPAPSEKRIVQSAGQVCWCDSPDDNWDAAADYISANCAADYLIIVADELLTDAADSALVEQLANKRADFNGFNVAIARMGQIDSTPDNSETPSLIRNLVESLYDGETAGHMEDGRLGFLLLLGDAVNSSGQVILPTSYWNLNNYATEDLNGSDAYFVLLDGTADVVPDLLVGRLPVDADGSNWELANVVAKITSYEPIGAASAWTDRILLMSGGDDEKFTFDGEGLSGFEGFFDAVESLVPGSGKAFVQMHRLAATSDIGFSKDVCDSIANGYSVVGLFDHANPVNFRYAFYPLHYDTLQNSNSPSLVLSFGSHSGFFDFVQSWKSWLP